MFYSQEALEDMALKVDLLEYASRTVDFVKKSGHTHYAICPFHSEKTASLAVDTDENFFHCFGCGRSGNIYTWIQWTEQLTFEQAVSKVAALTNSDLDTYAESETMAVYRLLNRLNQTRHKEKIERKVLDFKKDYTERYSKEIPDEWVEEGIPPHELDKYEIMIDKASMRIVYPVYDNEYNFVGVKGRTRFKNYKELNIMKYMNYYKVGIMDYFTGMKQAESFIKEENQIIIVEGLKSVMKLDDWGFHNTVSAETSKLNEYQIELLIRMQIKDIVIAFDKDVGIKKIKDNCKLLKKFANVYVVYDKWNLLESKDSPCDKGMETWKKLYERREKI